MVTCDASFPSQDFFPRIKENLCIIVVGVIIKDNHVLLIQEAKRSCYGKYFLPAGRLEAHETILDGVKREVREESGVEFEPKQLVLLESSGSCWLSITFLGDAVGGRLKTVPDSESLQARWFDVAEVRRLESEWRSLHQAHSLHTTGCKEQQQQQQQRSSTLLRAPILHMIEAALRFYGGPKDYSMAQSILLPADRMTGLRFMVYRLAIVWIPFDTTPTDHRPSHLLVRDVRPARLPMFRINGIDPSKAIEQALQTTLSTQARPTWDSKQVGILSMTFVPRRPPDAHNSATLRDSDGLLIVLRVPLLQTSPDQNLPETVNGYRWIELNTAMTTCLDASDQQLSSLIQYPLETDVLPLFHF